MANGIVPTNYKYGFSKPENYVFKSRRGLDKSVVEQISGMKNEPEWMREFRLRALEIFESKKMPTWGANLSTINFDNIFYYIKPTDNQKKSWEDLPKEIKDTYDAIGIPEAERKFLAGVTAQYESEAVYHSFQKQWEDKGVIFTDMDTGLRKYGDIVKSYFGRSIPAADNKFAALNSAVWSGGSFIYVPPGVSVDIPLQAYFRINAANMGQFERTLIIVDEGAYVHYVEGCFTRGALITTNPDYKPIEDVKVGDRVLTHTGEYKNVYRTQVRPYSGDLYNIKVYGDTTSEIKVTKEHPFLSVKRKFRKERNSQWDLGWRKPNELAKGDYLAVPVNKVTRKNKFVEFEIKIKPRNSTKPRRTVIKVPSTKEFFRLVGYYLAEGSVERGYYLHFSFNINEKEYIANVKRLLAKVFGIKKFYESVHRKNNGVSIVVSSAKLARIFEQFGNKSPTRRIPQWMVIEDIAKQRELVLGLFRGDGSYYLGNNKYGRKELFRINTTSEILARQIREILLRLGIVASLNKQVREKPRRAMYVLAIGGEFAFKFGELIGMRIQASLNGKKRAAMFGCDGDFAYVPIKKITKRSVSDISVYNFSVKEDESYVAGGVAVHNCTAPVYSTDSLHAAVVEIFVKKGARCRYTTIQNWSSNVYNLVTKRAFVEEEGIMEWVDGNIGSKITMKYPSCYLVGRGARGEILSLALANKGQHQDAGGKLMFLAPDTSGEIISKSVSVNGGRTSYRGLVKCIKGAKRVKCNVRCDALILDERSRSDTYPTMQVDEDNVTIGHEAAVSRINAEQLFYLMSRGLSELEATSLIVNGFIEPIVKELPLEYAVELNRLIQLNMENAVG